MSCCMILPFLLATSAEFPAILPFATQALAAFHVKRMRSCSGVEGVVWEKGTCRNALGSRRRVGRDGSLSPPHLPNGPRTHGYVSPTATPTFDRGQDRREPGIGEPQGIRTSGPVVRVGMPCVATRLSKTNAVQPQHHSTHWCPNRLTLDVANPFHTIQSREGEKGRGETCTDLPNPSPSCHHSFGPSLCRFCPGPSGIHWVRDAATLIRRRLPALLPANLHPPSP